MGSGAWRKSSRSGSATACVEVALSTRSTRIRDSKAPGRGDVAINAVRWRTFLSALKSGRYDT